MTQSRPKPWLAGIVDTLVGARIMLTSNIGHRNRLAVILIDTAFETACRAYLKHEVKIKLEESHKHRDNLLKAAKKQLSDIDKDVWATIDFYYSEIRNDFYHESAGKTITDVAVADYLDTVEFVIDKAFDVGIAKLADAELSLLRKPLDEAQPVNIDAGAQVTDIAGSVEKAIFVVGAISPSKVDQVNEYLKKAGDKTRFTSEQFRNLVARNSGSKKYFFYSKDTKTWELSGLGRFRLGQLKGEVGDGEED